MQVLAVANVLGGLLMVFALGYLPPIGAALFYRDGTEYDFLAAMAVNFAIGALLWLSTKRHQRELRPRDGYLLVTLGWLLMSGVAALPLMIVMPELSFTDAFFETLSGLTTTGSTVLAGLDHLPPAVNLWRHALQWYGGMGIIVLAIAILPLLGVGGMQLYKAEVPGAVKDTKLTPRIADTAKRLWLVYAGLTLLCMVALRLAGMSGFDAVNHAFSVMSLGGFSTHDASIGHFDSPVIEGVLVFFMFTAVLNFATHFAAFRGRSVAVYLRDAEAKAVVITLTASVLVVALYLRLSGAYSGSASALRYAAFNVVSVATTTGYASTDFGSWPPFATALMLLLSALASSTGSTGAGIKMFRTMMLAQQANREIKRLIHPRIVAPLRLGAQTVPNEVVYTILAFIFVYFMAVVAFTFLLMLSGMEAVTAFSAVMAWLNNMGPGLNEIGPAGNFAGLTDFQKWLGSCAMLAGRLELFTVFVLLTPGFWRR